MIQSIQRQKLLQLTHSQKKQVDSGSTVQKIVGNFEKMIDEVNKDQLKAEKKISELVTGKTKNVSSVMIALEKADISMRLLMATKNKAINAYQEIMRMQV